MSSKFSSGRVSSSSMVLVNIFSMRQAGIFLPICVLRRE